MSHERMLLANMTQPEAEEALRRGSVVLVTGSIEQHGGHLPLGTDAFAALTIVRVGERLQAPVVRDSARRGSLPPRLAGDAECQTGDIGGTDGRSVRDSRRRGVVVVNWHEGNSTAIRWAIVPNSSSRCVSSSPSRDHQCPVSGRDGVHPGSMETAAILAHDRLVRLDQRVEGDPVDRASEGHALFRRRDVFPILSDFREVAASGWYGTPDSISEERSREIIDAAAEYIVRSVEEVWQTLAERAPARIGRDHDEGRRVESVERPRRRGRRGARVAPGEVLVRVRACGLCGTDLKMVRGRSKTGAGRRLCPS